MAETVDLWRYSWYRTPDPSWADKDTIGRVRSALKKIDPKLDVWWCPDWRPRDPEQTGRWAIMYYMSRAQNWSVVFYWETQSGEFISLNTDCIERILKMLAEIDAEKPGGDVYSIERAAQFMQKKNEEARRAELRDVLQQHAKSYGRRLDRRIIQVGAGGGPASLGQLGSDPDFDAFLRERGIR